MEAWTVEDVAALLSAVQQIRNWLVGVFFINALGVGWMVMARLFQGQHAFPIRR